MLHELTQFVMRHYLLLAATVIVLILLILEEIDTQIGSGKQLSVTEVTHLINHEKATVIDLRDVDAYKNGHIIGAQQVSEADFGKFQERIQKRDKNPIILVDANGAKAPGLAARLKKEHVDNVHVLKGGMMSWTGANMPIIKKQQKLNDNANR